MNARLSTAAVANCIEGNLKEYSLLAGRTPNGKIYAGPDVTWINSGTDALNRVLAADFPDRQADVRIGEVVANFGGRPLTWIIGSQNRPANIGPRLLTQGFAHLMVWQGMACLLDEPPAASPCPLDFEIREVCDQAGIITWGETAGAGFAMPPTVRRDFPGVFASLATDRLVYFLGLLSGQPVATASLYYGDGDTAGAYFISTLASARRQGIALAMTTALLRHAYGRGQRMVVLEASPSGYEVYTRLGFRQYCRMDAYSLNTDSGR